MDTRELLIDAFRRIPPLVRRHAKEADDRLLHTRPDPEANSLAWLLWHTSRQQDAQVAELAGREQVWTSGGWQARFDLPLEPDDHGYGHTAEQVALVRVEDVDLLVGYQDAVSAMTDEYLATTAAADLDRVVDDGYDPPVTAGVRLISVVGDALQHLGQAGYLRGLLERSHPHHGHGFDERAATWDDDPAKVERARIVAEAIRQAVPVTGDTRVLEYGAGTGLLAQFLAPHVGAITVADPSEGMRAVMLDKVERGELPGAEVVDIDLDTDARFDLVVSLMALHHVPEPADALGLLATVTEPDGVIALVDLEAEDGSFHGEGFGGHHGFEPGTLDAWLVAAGFGAATFTRVHTVAKDGRNYPLFLAVARRQGT